MKKILIILQFIVLSIHLGWAAEQDVFDPNKLAAIKILPYHPSLYVLSEDNETLKLKSLSNLPRPLSSTESSPRFGRPYTSMRGEPSEFKIGETFRYITQDEYSRVDPEKEAFSYMGSLINYHKDFNDKNVLIAQIQITTLDDKNSPIVYKYLFGAFVSGGQSNYTFGEIRKLTGVDQNLPIPLKNSLESKFLRLLWEDKDTKKQIEQYSIISDNLELSNEENIQKLLSENIYSAKTLKINNKKLAPINNNGLGRLEDIISLRLFSFPEGHVLRTLLNNPTTVPKSKELETSIKKDIVGLNREKLTQQVFGRPCYQNSGSIKACLNKASDLEPCFNQSEQAFLTWLEKVDSLKNNFNELPHCYSPNPFPKEGNYSVSNIQVNLYSFLDICRYCRGTMAYMLGTGKMLDVFIKFFNKLGVELNPKQDAIQIFAFSYENTGID
jgi:hypothetical protein